MSTATAFANVDAYDLWARNYPPVPHNPLMRAEQEAMLRLWPDTGTRALDLACGTGRYSKLLVERGVAHVVAVDLSTQMLRLSNAAWRVRADMARLPFANASFDVITCGLAVGHAPDLFVWMTEMSRILEPGGVLLYSDFHPSAAAAGMTRSFTDEANQKHTLIHCRHEVSAHAAAARAAGLEVDAMQEVRVGFELREAFSGSEQFYQTWHGLPVVLVVRTRKPADA